MSKRLEFNVQINPITLESQADEEKIIHMELEWRRKKASNKGYDGFGENDISDDVVFVSNGTVLPL